MAIFRAPTNEDKDYDDCNQNTEAVLEIGSITIPLCRECINDLIDNINAYNKTTFCKDCIYYHPAGYDKRMGTCEHKYLQDHETFDMHPDDYGYSYCTGFMKTCFHATTQSIIEKDI